RSSDGNLRVFRTNDLVSPAVLATFDNRPNIDQPWVDARRVVGGPDDGKLRVYVGYNDLAVLPSTAAIDVCLDGLAAAPAFNAVKLDTRIAAAGGRQDAPPVRPVSHSDGTVYATFVSWLALDATRRATANVVVVRDDHWGIGATPFTDLKDASDGLAGRLVATNVGVNVGANMGQERLLGNDLAIAVDPRNSSTVYLVWADNSGSSYTLRARRSTDKGVTWSGDLLTADSATMASLTINSRGVVGLMYQQLKNGNWETHFRRTTDESGANWDDAVLSKTPSAAPLIAGTPYLGDWARVVAVGTTFFGVFCANNTPDPGNFPNGVRFQRNRTTLSPYQLLNSTKTAPVAASIDPFFFRVREG